MPKGELYNDLHPENSLKNTGFKDISTAIHTINLMLLQLFHSKMGH